MVMVSPGALETECAVIEHQTAVCGPSFKVQLDARDEKPEQSDGAEGRGGCCQKDFVEGDQESDGGLSCGGFPTATNPRRAKQTGESSVTVRSSKRVSKGTEGVEAESQVVGPEMKNDNKGKRWALI